MRHLVPGLAALLAVLAAVACSGEERGSDQPPSSVGQDQLAIMVLSADTLGAAAAGLQLDAETSGVRDNEAAAAGSLDPDDNAAELERAGRITGYELDYADSDLTALAAAEGIYEIGTRVQLFTDAGAASQFLTRQIADYVRLDGAGTSSAYRLNGVSTFSVDIGDEAIGLTTGIGLGQIPLHGTLVSFRVGPLLATAQLLRSDDVDDAIRVQQIARTLEQRIEGVLRGEVTGEPVPLPAPRSLGPPASDLDPATMALRLEDLPAGTAVADEGYVDDTTAVATFRRSFDVSSLLRLETEVRLLGSSAEASLALAGIAEELETGASVERPAAADLGDDSLAISAVLETEQSYAVVVQVGRAVGAVLAVGDTVDPATVRDLARALVARMDSAFGG